MEASAAVIIALEEWVSVLTDLSRETSLGTGVLGPLALKESVLKHDMRRYIR